MENTINKILIDREKKDLFIKKHIDDYQVVSLKANIPGINKNIKEAYLLINIFNQYISFYNPIKTMYFESYDGPYYIYLFNKNKCLKNEMMKIESKNKIARFIDIDVYYNGFHSLNRSKARKCYICNDNALICSKTRKHDVLQLLDYIRVTCNSYLKRTVKKMIEQAMMQELNLHPKFGLVTPYTNGSHLDMDYKLMINAKNAIIDSLVEMFMLGYQSNLKLDELFYQARIIGKKADKKMFKATNGINAYQGLIFNLGLVLVNLGRALLYNFDFRKIYENIKIMSNEFIKEGNYGARKQASLGYSVITNLLDNYDISNMSTMDMLIYFINNLDDTILQKRCKDEKLLKKIKDDFKSLKSSDELLINQINKECVENNLSFGGCADLLVVTIFIINFSNHFSKINHI